MNIKSSLLAVAIAALAPITAANAFRTIQFGPTLPAGTVPDGYDGFNWHGAQNDVYADASASFFDSASVTEMSRHRAFDLNAVDFENFNSDAPSPGDTSNFVTVITGYRHGIAVGSLAESYGYGDGAFTHLNLDDVTKVTFATTFIATYFGDPITHYTPDITLIDSLKVSRAAGALSAPEMNATAGAGALTLLAGALWVLTGGRRGKRAAQ